MSSSVGIISGSKLQLNSRFWDELPPLEGLPPDPFCQESESSALSSAEDNEPETKPESSSIKIQQIAKNLKQPVLAPTRRSKRKLESVSSSQSSIDDPRKKKRADAKKRMDAAIESLREKPNQSWCELARKRSLHYSSLIRRAKAEGFIRPPCKVDRPSKRDMNARINQALKSLRENPDQFWSQVAKSHSLHYPTFVQKAKEEGFVKKPSNTGRTLSDEEKKAKLEARIDQALKSLKENPNQPWGPLSKENGIHYYLFVKRAEENGFKRNPTGVHLSNKLSPEDLERIEKAIPRVQNKEATPYQLSSEDPELKVRSLVYRLKQMGIDWWVKK